MFDSNGSAGGDGFWGFKGTSFRKVLLYTVMALLLVAALMILGDTIGHHIRAVDSWMASLGPWGVLVFITRTARRAVADAVAGAEPARPTASG